MPNYEQPKSCWGPWDKYCDYCKKKGTFFHFGQEWSDPWTGGQGMLFDEADIEDAKREGGECMEALMQAI